MCVEDLGALIFFVDPLSAHPHQADIDSLIRLTNCGNVIVCANPTSAMSMMHTLKCALEKGSRGMVGICCLTMRLLIFRIRWYEFCLIFLFHWPSWSYLHQIPSFFETLESPAVAEYKNQQELALAAAVAGKSPVKPTLMADPSMYFPSADDDEDDDDDDEDVLDIVEEMQSKVSFDTAAPETRTNRSSQLYGISQPVKKKKGILKKIGKSIKKLHS